jgi:hypothetical protein
MKYMTDIEYSAQFGVLDTARKAAGFVTGLPGQLATRVKGAPAAVVDSVTTATTPKAGFLDRAIGIGTLASVPLGVSSMVLPDANTRAVESMRKADTVREAAGLKPLAMTPQLIAEKAAQAAQAGSVRVANIKSNRIPTPDLAPGSMM